MSAARAAAPSLRRVGVLTSGGDAPGMNCAIRAVVRAGTVAGAEVWGIRRGFTGLLEDDMELLTSRSVGDILQRGGTILHTTRCPEFQQSSGIRRALRVLHARRIQGLVVIGGNGSAHGSLELHRAGMPVMHVPSTIDNDLSGSVQTIGFDTAVNTAVDAINRLRDTAGSLDRIFVVEVMGRRSGFIALWAGLACGAEAILIPEVPVDFPELVRTLRAGRKRGKAYSLVVVAEGSGSGPGLARRLERALKVTTRAVVLGHIQRGGSPSAYDRVLASRLATRAVYELLRGTTGQLVGWVHDAYLLTPIETALRTRRRIDRELYDLLRVLSQ
jgi:6-phosphofructokinase 1